MNEYAVIVRAGRNSLHREWLSGGAHRFDLLVAAYEELDPSHVADAADYVVIPGYKVAGWRRYLARDWERLRRYSAVALMDDDISCSAEDIIRTFEAGMSAGLSIWQPSLSWDSYFSHAITLRHPTFRLRFTNFVEMQCPFMSRDYLELARPLFETGVEIGIDQVWCRLLQDNRYRAGVIDEVSVRHTRPVGSLRAAQGFVGENAEYLDAIAHVKRSLGYEFRGAVSYAGITRSGHRIENKLLMSLLALAPLAGWTASVNEDWFVRPILNHAGRNSLTPVDHERISVAALAGKRPTSRDHVARVSEEYTSPNRGT